MNAQTQRRHEPYVWTWEPAFAGLLLTGLAWLLLVHAARAVANLFAGSGWTWTPSADLLTSLPGIISGDATAGLPIAPPHPASPALLVTLVVTVSFLLLVAAMILVVWAMRRWGPSRIKGMATLTEVRAVLGEHHLHKVRAVVRPDLYGHAARRDKP